MLRVEQAVLSVCCGRVEVIWGVLALKNIWNSRQRAEKPSIRTTGKTTCVTLSPLMTEFVFPFWFLTTDRCPWAISALRVSVYAPRPLWLNFTNCHSCSVCFVTVLCELIICVWVAPKSDGISNNLSRWTWMIKPNGTIFCGHMRSSRSGTENYKGQTWEEKNTENIFK